MTLLKKVIDSKSLVFTLFSKENMPGTHFAIEIQAEEADKMLADYRKP